MIEIFKRTIHPDEEEEEENDVDDFFKLLLLLLMMMFLYLLHWIFTHMDTTNTKIFGNKNTSQLQHMGKSSANDGIQFPISFPHGCELFHGRTFSRQRSSFTSPGLSSFVGFEIWWNLKFQSVFLLPSGKLTVAGWNIPMFNRKCIDSLRVHFPATAMLDDPGVFSNGWWFEDNRPSPSWGW